MTPPKPLLDRANLALAAAVFLLNLALNVPLFLPGEMAYRDSIEGGYAGMARFFSENPNPWGWNPTQYGGLPAQFTYLPSLPYVAGIVSRIVPSLPPDYAYRILASTFACLGPATLFLFVLYFTRNRWWALGAALAYTFLSPLYYLIHTIDLDRGKTYLPWRMQVLVKYGEGPHNAGLALLPLALVAVWNASVTRGVASMFGAAVLLAAIALTNWVAALALACCCLLILVTLAGSFRETGFRAERLFAAAGIAYGLACFWLTPTFIKTIAFNWPVDAFNYHLLGPQRLLLAGLPLGVLALRFLLGRIFPGQRYLWFIAMATFAFSWVVVWFYSRGLNTIPESRRYALEMEMFLVLLFFELFRLTMRAPIPPLRFFGIYAALAVFLSGWGQIHQYATQGFGDRRPTPKENTIEYSLAARLADLHPQGRVFASGGLRFRLNSWFPIHQVGGGFESGLTNRAPLSLSYRIRTEAEDPAPDLKTLGAEYVVVHGPKSREHYRDFKNPARFEKLETVWRVEDDTIYRVPFSSLAHAGDAPLSVSWRGSSALSVEGPVSEGQRISLQVNHDPGWSAMQDGRPLSIERDRLGYMTIHATQSPAARIDLNYGGSIEQRVMAALSAICWIGSILLLFRNR